MYFKKLNRKEKRNFVRFLTSENVKQSSENLYSAFLKYQQDLMNNPNMLKKQNLAKSAIWSDTGVSLHLVKYNHR
jgi:hypothetical protein